MKIKDLRKSVGLSQEDLAGKLSVKRTTVCKWETGKTNPRAELLPKIAKVLNCTIDELLCSEEPEEKTKSQTSGNL